MSQTVAQLLDAALALSEIERAELAALLAASLGNNSNSLHPGWAAELRRRVADVASGQVHVIPWDEVRRQVRAQLDAGEPSNA